MSESSVDSSKEAQEKNVQSVIRFDSYKVDHISFDMEKDVRILASNASAFADWNLQLGFGKPVFSKGHQKYIITLTASLNCTSKDNKSKEKDGETGEDHSKPILTCTASIAGLFSVVGDIKKETLSLLIRQQLPTILLPYLRGTITTVLANAGFGSVILPLVNMVEVARQQPQEIEIEEIN